MIWLADLCFRRRRLVLAGWGLLLLAALLAGLRFPATHRADYQTPGAEATRAFEILEQRFPARGGDSINVVFSAADDLANHRTAIESLLSSVASFPHVASVRDPFAPGNERQWASDRTIAFAVVNLDSTIDKLANLDPRYQERFLDLVRPGIREGLRVEVTTFLASTALGNEGVALVFAVLVLLLAFGSVVAAGLPVLTALFGLGVGAAVGSLLTRVQATPDWATTVATMIGLGVGIDYALFIVTRYRSSLGAGMDPHLAVRVSMATAGRTVLFAGGVVVLSLLGMVTMGLGYVNGVFLASVVAVLSMLAASLTLLPAVLGFIGPNINRLRIPMVGTLDPGDRHGLWFHWSRTVQRWPWTAFGAGAVLLALLSLPVFRLRLGLPDDGNRVPTETSRRAYDLMATAFGPGFNGPLLVVIDARGTIPARRSLEKAVAELESLEGVASMGPILPNAALDAAILVLYPTSSPQSARTERLVRTLRREVIPRALEGTGMSAVVGGFTAISIDQAAYVMRRLPWFIGVVVFLSFLLLTVVFRSPIVAFKAGVMNLLSIASAYGVMAYAVDGTWLGDLLAIPETPVPAFVPMIMFAVLFGLSMDYEVFLLARVREAYLHSGDNSTAVATGLSVTARVITAAAAIMVFVFGVFIFDPNVFIKQIGLGLTVAILVDATLVRIVLVPATMELLGNLNWWMPRWLGRLLPDLHARREAGLATLRAGATPERRPR